jgi:hypothetical protein
LSLKGIQFLFDAEGKETAVLINLRHNRQVWEDIYDVIVADSRKDEPRVAWEDVKRRLKARRASRG